MAKTSVFQFEVKWKAIGRLLLLANHLIKSLVNINIAQVYKEKVTNIKYQSRCSNVGLSEITETCRSCCQQRRLLG